MRNILFCGNSKVFDGVLTCMLSVLKRTHATDPFCFYIFTMDMTRIRPEYTPISEDMTNFLERVAKKFHPQNRVISVDVTVLYERYFGGCPNESAYCSPYTLLRLLADLVPGMPDKLLYLDADLLFQRDIRLLYDKDVSHVEYAAARDHYGKYLISPDYINAGVLLLNMKNIRRTGLFMKARKLLQTKKLIFADQSAIIRSTRAKMLLPQKFNDHDLIGRVYEYFLQAFSINADKEEGEFYTPHSIVELIASLIEPFDGTVYDPCCGSGGMFVQAAKFIEAHGGNTKAVNVYGQESEPATYRLAKMNLAIRGISYHLGDRAISTFSDDQHKELKFDYIMANPPFNLKKYAEYGGFETDPRWQGYGIPPTSNANYAWILHILNKLNVCRGIAGFLLANGALDDSDTQEIRKQLIESDKVEAIIVLPRNMFYSTDISVTLWILNNNKKGGPWHGRQLRDRTGEILFIDLRTWNSNIYEKKYVRLSETAINRVRQIYFNWQTENFVEYAEPELYYAAHRDEIQEKGYSLVPSRYIEFIDRDTEIDYKSALYEMSHKFDALKKRWDENETELVNAFKVLGYGKE